MKVYISLKQVGKRNSFIGKKCISFDTKPLTVKELIKQTIMKCVDEYENQIEYMKILNCFSDINRKNKDIYNKNNNNNDIKDLDLQYIHYKKNIDENINTAFDYFEECSYKIFIGVEELTSLSEKICINENDELTIIDFSNMPICA